MTYAPTNFEVATSNSLGEVTFTRKYSLTFDLDIGANVTHVFAQYPLHHVAYSPIARFEVATSNRYGRDTFTRKYIIQLLTLILGSRSHIKVLSTLYIMSASYDLFNCKV